jgi:energy-converting hydrogenase A subunit M
MLNSENFPTRPAGPFEAVEALVKELSLPEGFYDELLQEDDWSFIIKLHALVEAAVTGLLLEALGQKELHDVISKLALSDKYMGKMAIIKSLSLLKDEYRRFIVTLSQVRNDFVHDVSNVSASLKEYIVNSTKFDSFTEAFCLGKAPVEFDERKLGNKEYMREDPKQVIWTTAAVCLGVIYVQKLNKTDIAKLKEQRQRVFGQLEGIMRVVGIESAAESYLAQLKVEQEAEST